MNRLLTCAMIAAVGMMVASSASLADPDTAPAAPAKQKTAAKERPKAADPKAKPAAAAAASLKVGDPAPAISLAKTIKGDPITSFSRDSVYVVEFWATWCGPCIQNIPHLSEVAKKFSGKVKVLGVSVWERDQAAVEPFVTKQGDKMKYTVAMDSVPKGGEGAMAQSWLKAAGRTGIPSAFIVDADGKIAWIGHPAGADMEAKLTELTAKSKATDPAKPGDTKETTPAKTDKTAKPAVTPAQPATPK